MPIRYRHIGVTAARTSRPYAQLDFVARWLIRNDGGELHHGDCEGGDVEVARIAAGLNYRIVCHPPDDPKHRAYFQLNDYCHDPAPYLERNRAIVKSTRILLALPETRKELLRSGTWSTVRYARKIGRPVLIIYPQGDTSMEGC